MSIDWDQITHFSAAEFDGPMDAAFVRRLDRAREWAGVPFVLTSTFRANSDTSHGVGYGVDVRCHNARDRFHILDGLFQMGFHRLGIYDRHIHVDNWPAGDPEVVWLGKSE